MPADSTKPAPLIFHWPRPLEQGKRLIFWMMVVTVGLAIFFYLFQVVYPQSQRRTPIPHQIILLDPADPTARAILSKVQDRDFLVLPGDDTVTDGVRLEEHAPLFHPSFEKHKLELQDLPHKAFTVPPARLLNLDDPPLPALDLSELKGGSESANASSASAAARKPMLVMKLGGGLAGRAVVQPPDLAGVSITDPGSCQFQLGVDALGQVWFAQPLREAESPELSRSLSARLLKARFAPLPAKDEGAASRLLSKEPPAWGIATFEWQTAP